MIQAQLSSARNWISICGLCHSSALSMRDGDKELPRVIPSWELKDPEQL